MTINDVFMVYSYHQVTDEELYLNEGNIPVYTGNCEIKGYWNKTFVENMTAILPCIAFPLKGNNSGYSYILNSSFDANNTGLLVTRPN
jgi:hypothetical protein